MKSSDYRASIPVPPAEMILRYLNDEPRSKIDLLNYYENYIHSAAVRIEFFQSLPILHRKLMNMFSSND